MADGWMRYLRDARVRRHAIALIRSPDDSKVKQKMLFASSKDALRRSLVGIASEIQGTDYSEVAYESGAFVYYSHCVASTEVVSAVLDKVSRVGS